MQMRRCIIEKTNFGETVKFDVRIITEKVCEEFYA